MAGRPSAFRQTLQSAAVATGNGSAMDVAGLASVGVQLQGISTATVTWEGTIDGTTWAGLQGVPLSTGTAATTATADGLYRLDVRGVAQIRARISAYTSGTITATALGEVE